MSKNVSLKSMQQSVFACCAHDRLCSSHSKAGNIKQLHIRTPAVSYSIREIPAVASPCMAPLPVHCNDGTNVIGILAQDASHGAFCGVMGPETAPHALHHLCIAHTLVKGSSYLQGVASPEPHSARSALYKPVEMLDAIKAASVP